MRAWLCAAIILAAGLSCASAGADDAAGRVLAESDFSFDMDGWEVDGDAGARDAAHMSKMIKAGDDGADEWYFVAPHKFTGSKREAYGGSLLFRHGFFEFNSDGKDTQRGFDVLISSDAHGLTIGRQGLFPAWSFSSDHKLELIESAGWLVTDTNQPPSRPEMVRLLSKISSIKIRGGIYVGKEDAYIMDVKLVAGPPQELSGQRTSLKTQAIHSDL